VIDKNDGKATQKAAKDFNTNRQYITDAEKIKDADPELAEDVKSDKTTIAQAKKKIRKEETKKNNPELAFQKFGIILIQY